MLTVRPFETMTDRPIHITHTYRDIPSTPTRFLFKPMYNLNLLLMHRSKVGMFSQAREIVFLALLKQSRAYSVGASNNYIL